MVQGAHDRFAKNLANFTIVVIHPVPLMRLGLATALREAPALPQGHVLSFGHVSEAREALACLGSGDIIIADVSEWAHLDQIRSMPEFKLSHINGVSLALISSADVGALRLMESRGISGVFAPDANTESLIDLVIELAAGRSSFPKSASATASSKLSRLSNRQFEILELMTRGLLNKQIAWELGLTEGTVKSHVSAILDKLGCDRRTQAIAAFMQSVGMGQMHADNLPVAAL
jgi:DNA-binding NarL/FixJ family response regulator